MSTPTPAETLPQPENEHGAVQEEEQNVALQLARDEIESTNARVRELEAQVENVRTRLFDSLMEFAQLTLRVRRSDGSVIRNLRVTTKETPVHFNLPIGRLAPKDNVEVEVVARNIADSAGEEQQAQGDGISGANQDLASPAVETAPTSTSQNAVVATASGPSASGLVTPSLVQNGVQEEPQDCS